MLLLGETLIAFRDTNGKVGLVDAYCPHRRAPLFFGRNEECGLRCVYHGWKFDADGNCVELPSEPDVSPMKNNIKITHYPTVERGGAVYGAYWGGQQRICRRRPTTNGCARPETHRHLSKTVEHCNWLQALESGLSTPRLVVSTQQQSRQPERIARDGAPRIEVE